MNNELNPMSQVPRVPVETADTLRSKAKQYLMEAGIHGLLANRIVECIIGAAVLEVSDLMRDVMRDAMKEAGRG